MKNIIVYSILFILCQNYGQAESVSVPLTGVKKPSSDLLDSKGQKLEVGQAAQLIETGFDLSTLNPIDNEIWQNQKYQVTDDKVVYPEGEKGVQWVYPEAAYSESYMSMYMGRVSSGDGRMYRFTLSRATHAALLRAALLRKIGYYIPTPRFYQNLKVRFADEKSKNDFLDQSQAEMGTDFESRKWIKEDNKVEHSLTFVNAVLEPAQADYFDLAWGFAPPAKDPNQLAKLKRLSVYRAFRGLIVPYVLADIPESMNRYSTKVGSVLSQQLVLNHPFADSFDAAAIEDIRWIARKVLALNENDLREIVSASKLPTQLQELAYAKLVYRIYNLSELSGLKSLFALSLPNLKINSADGIVKDGKVTVEYIAGYPQRFSHGGRQSPYSEGDLGRYLKIDGISSILESALSELGKKLEFYKMSDAIEARQKDVINQVIQHYRKNPFVPYTQKVEGWGGPIGGLDIQSSRHIATGAFFNSTASLQLVDHISVGGHIGYFGSLDGIKNIIPIAGANLSIQRDYTHVRPLLSMQEGNKESWKKVFVPSVLRSFSKMLSKGKVEGKDHPADAFMRELRDGEVFLITDSISTAAYAQISTPIDVLLGIAPLNFVNTLTLGADASKIILGQTLIIRTKAGIQVFVKKQNAQVFGTQFDMNMFIKMLTVRAQTTQQKTHSDAFVIEYDPEYTDQLDEKDEKNAKYFETRGKLQRAMRALFKENDSEILYSQFKDKMFEIDNNLKSQELRTQMLVWKTKGFSEAQLVKLTPPDGKNSAVSIFGYKKGQLVGMDLLGLGIDLVNGVLQKNNSKLNWSGTQSPNPANTPYGKSYWRLVDSQYDVSPEKMGPYGSSASIQHVWGGWSIKREAFYRLLDEIQKDYLSSEVAGYRLIEKESFMNMESLDFYRITAQASLTEKGIVKLYELILQPEAKGQSVEKAKYLARIFQKLSGGSKARASDREMYDEVIKLIGGGDYQKGLSQYMRQCQEQDGQAQSLLEKGKSRGAWYYGTNYECLIPWMQNLLQLARSYPTIKTSADKKALAKWGTEVLWVLDQNIPIPMLLKYLGQENYIYFVRINGFRKGDEDGDLEFFSNTVGQPPTSFEYSNGLMNYWSTKARILPGQIDLGLGGF